MDLSLLPEILASTIRLSVPLVLACLAGLWSEKSGIVDIGLEGKMLAAAFAAAASASYFQSAWIGLAIAMQNGQGFAHHGTLHATTADRAGHFAVFVDRHRGAGVSRSGANDVDDSGDRDASSVVLPPFDVVENLTHEQPLRLCPR